MNDRSRPADSFLSDRMALTRSSKFVDLGPRLVVSAKFPGSLVLSGSRLLRNAS